MARKKPKLVGVPNCSELISPTFTALKSLGGTATNSEICLKVFELMKISTEIYLCHEISV